jgi:hypothetical protein
VCVCAVFVGGCEFGVGGLWVGCAVWVFVCVGWGSEKGGGGCKCVGASGHAGDTASTPPLFHQPNQHNNKHNHKP